MYRMNHEEGRYRVLLIGIGDNTEGKKESFCKKISEVYGISLPLLRKLVDRCPTVLKKNLSLRKADILAKTLESFGAMISVEEKRDSSAVFLEFQGIASHQIGLEASYLRKTESGAWNVIGRARNISAESLTDTWVIIQLFDDFEEFLTFEEVPLPINPLPPGEASPFKVVFEGDLPVKRVSIGFKNSSGTPLPAVDRREKREWVEVKLEVKDEEGFFPSSPFLPIEEQNEPQPLGVTASSDEISKPPQTEFPSLTAEESQAKKEEGEGKIAGEQITLEHEDISSEEIFELPEKGFSEVNETQEKKELERLPEHEPLQNVAIPAMEKGEAKETEGALPDLGSLLPNRENIFPETGFDVSLFEEATKLLEEISRGPVEKVKEESFPFPWIEDFRNSVESYYQKHPDMFASWFESHRKKNEFAHSLHPLLTLLTHARFHQKNQSEKALENTEKVFKFILQPNLLLEDIPLLEGTPFFSGENWRELFHKAIPRLQQVGNNILEKKRWNAFDLERLIKIIPHMSDTNSRMAIRWIHELIPELIEIDFSNLSLSIGESLYRVGSRLGVVDPYFDYCQGKNSTGDLKIQTFAKAVYPQHPMKIEEPMTWVGMTEEDRGGGYCLLTQPRCAGCLFESFCPRLHLDFNPSEKGMKGQ